MSDWQVGDLAVCVDASERWSGNTCVRLLQKGSAYTVSAVPGCGVVVLAEIRNPHDVTGGFWADRFRKITPDKHEDCEPEFVELLKRSRVKA